MTNTHETTEAQRRIKTAQARRRNQQNMPSLGTLGNYARKALVGAAAVYSGQKAFDAYNQAPGTSPQNYTSSAPKHTFQKQFGGVSVSTHDAQNRGYTVSQNGRIIEEGKLPLVSRNQGGGLGL
ncbi:MAG: hypothetical protein MK137_05365 [Rickettsiales bacterium]|nr:hypothetical protein [Rickettsiales bacterium]